MKKMKKIFSAALTLLIVAVASVTSMITTSAAPSSITIEREGVMVSYIGENYKWAKFITSDDKVAYCLDLAKNWPESSSTVSLIDEGDAGLTYILANGYPYKSITGNNDQDRFITQAAVWWYLADTGQTTSLSEDFTTNSADPYGLRDHIETLVEAAKNASEDADPTLSVSLSDSSMSLTDDEDYYISESITPTLSGVSTYQVSVSGAPSGTTVVNSSGEEQTTFSSGDSFQIKMPADAVDQTTTFEITVSATGTTTKSYVYQSSDTSYQRLGVLYTDDVDLSEAISLTVTVDTTTGVTISVPNTAAKISLIILGVGLVIIAGGVAIVIYRDKKLNKSKK